MNTSPIEPENVEINVERVKQRSVSGVFVYSIRTVFLQIIAIIAGLLLSAFLQPSEFGDFVIITAFVNIFRFVSDIGLAASLIQKKAPPTQIELRTTFTVQQTLALGIFSIIFLFTPVWRNLLNLDDKGIYLLYALGLSFIFSSLKTIPSILMERKLNFDKLIIPEIVESLAFYSLVVYFAWRGFGITSYTIALISQGVVGVLTTYLIFPWRPSIGFSKQAFRGLIRFGVPFQVNDLLARLKDDLLLIVVRKMVSPAEFGYIGWGQKWAQYPMRFTVGNVIRVTFPAYSRLQHNTDLLKKAIEKSLYFISAFIFPLLFGMAAMAYPLTMAIPQYAKWQPALPVLYLFIINVFFASLATPLTNAINAIGEINITLKLMIFWTTLTWLVTVPATIRFGYLGVPLASAVVGASSIITIIIIKRIINVNVVGNTIVQFIAGAGMFTCLIFVRPLIENSLSRFLVITVFGGALYVGLLVVIGRKQLFEELRSFRSFAKS